MKSYRTEQDALGEVRIPQQALYGPQTQRALENFPLSGTPMPCHFIHALAQIKSSAARANQQLGLLAEERCQAIVQAAEAISAGRHDDQFPIDLFQTGSGTSTNMNMNEVIVHLAKQQSGLLLHPNDEVNLGQSSNDLIPTAIHLATLQRNPSLLQAISHLQETISAKGEEFADLVKCGRTHLMDAVPIRLEQEFSGWSAQLEDARERIQHSASELSPVALGGTAVGTGLNTHPRFASLCLQQLAELSGVMLTEAPNHFAAQASVDRCAAYSADLRGLAQVLIKLCNDLRLMNSGPVCGFNEITLPALQPGSSIMPGKVNPVICEAIIMLSTQVIGLDTAVGLSAQSGQFQLNTMLPLVAYNLDQSQLLLHNACRVLADKAIAGIAVNRQQIAQSLSRNPVIATALVPRLGYDLCARIIHRAMEQQRPILAVAQEMSDLSEQELRQLLDPEPLTRPGTE
ncbi:class II fumarate hydratase [Aestuariirhabdus litorea]|uniref:Class II fumarate hydratase n=1 Tax=Aestuariirhabdus litorea TaxID=2528527 RepID=A0A3P3VKL5_9GAMM|nr:class II fumarate hydratase [Aestuariirhabdus litorea]RRJ82847.1 class II fumarate hydratase [Aestuariirhabdus litorea]RWW93006.1 aspartate ammonia-lyase [Endozoicomonadaceae bacterium GTF-13]